MLTRNTSLFFLSQLNRYSSQTKVTIKAESGQHLWQLDLKEPHNGIWSRITVKRDSSIYANRRIQWNLPRLVTTDSEGMANVIAYKFSTWAFGYAELRYEKWSFKNNSLSNREFLELEVLDPYGFCNETCLIL